MNDVPVVEVSRCGFARGTLLGEHVLALILRMMTGGLLKTVSNWTGLTVELSWLLRQSAIVASVAIYLTILTFRATDKREKKWDTD